MKTALISVFDKTKVVDLARFLLNRNYQILSTGGTFKKLQEACESEDHRSRLIQISDYTGSPEILNGRVKTLHPKIHGGLLARTDLPEHVAELETNGILPIDVVVTNLYPFHRTQEEALSLEEAQELIDIGGVTLIRAAAKNFQRVTVLTDPNDYEYFIDIIDQATVEGDHLFRFRKNLATKAFEITSAYDAMIVNYLLDDDQVVYRMYRKNHAFKYGCNPHQNTAALYNICPYQSPFKVLNGQVGYINMLDAINAWQLVSEVKKVVGLTCAASFKHTSPAGVAVCAPLSDVLKEVYDAGKVELSDLATAYLRARNSDPKSSFGDFIGLSDVCDEATAQLIKREVSDGVIAPGYTQEALAILSAKKNGKYLILEVDPAYENPQAMEYREMYGVALAQNPNRGVVDFSVFENPQNIVTKEKELPEEAKINLLLANIALKYTQSNSVAIAADGQVVAIAAGQQSRVDCVELCVSKFQTWLSRLHPKVLQLRGLFRKDVPIKRPDKINATLKYAKGDFSNEEEYRDWAQPLFGEIPERLEADEWKTWITSWLESDEYPVNVAMASDAFFPFPDSIEEAVNAGVDFVIQPGGSQADPAVVEECDKNEITMVFTGLREFTH